MIKISAPVRIDISGGWPDSDPYRKDYGGAVLNAAINQRVYGTFDGFQKTDPAHVLPHSGLGTSGALRAVEIAVSNPTLLGDRFDLVRRVHMLENQVIGHRSGFQDEAAAICGGVNYWQFEDDGSIGRTPVARDKASFLQNQLVLIYTGRAHVSANIHDLVFGKEVYEKNIPRLDRMKAIAGEMFDNIQLPRKMANLISETWDLQRSLHPSIETDEMREIQRRLKGYYSATRAIGAGGGGCMIFYGNRERILYGLKKIKPHFKNLIVIPFEFDYEGIRIERTN